MVAINGSKHGTLITFIVSTTITVSEEANVLQPRSNDATLSTSGTSTLRARPACSHLFRGITSSASIWSSYIAPLVWSFFIRPKSSRPCTISPIFRTCSHVVGPSSSDHQDIIQRTPRTSQRCMAPPPINVESSGTCELEFRICI